jgi:hypothetical protein
MNSHFRSAAFITLITWGQPTFAQQLQPDKIPVSNWPMRRIDVQTSPVSASAVSGASGSVFIAITPCRVMDTREQGGSGKTGSFGPPSLLGGQARAVSVPSSNCGVPAAQAYSMNFVSITPFGRAVGWIAAWQSDRSWPGTVILNAPQGGIVSNSAIVQAGMDGGIQVLATDNSDLVIDLNGYYVQAPVVVGPQGPSGETGASGLPGLTGSPGSAGSQGVQGIQGIAGTAGAPGGPGGTGAIGPIGPPLSFQGTWSNVTTYATGDAVFMNGSSYISLSGGNIGNTPTNGAPWALFAQQGSIGATGAVGTNGTNGTNGTPGTNGTQGLQGVIGPAGAAGPPQMFVAQFSNIAAATSFAGLNGPITNQTIGAVATIMPSACTFNAFYVAGTITGSVAPDTLTLTVMKNGVATSMTVSMALSVAGTTVVMTDTSHPFSVVAGDSVAIQVFQTNFTGPLVRVSATTQCQ